MQQTGKPPYDHSKRHGEAAPWDLVMQTRKGNVADASYYVAVLFLVLLQELRPLLLLLLEL